MNRVRLADSFSSILIVFNPSIRLGFELIKSIIFDNSSLPFKTVFMIGNTVSNPRMPNSDFSNSHFLPSISIGVWSEETASIVPSNMPLISACLVFSSLNGGITFKLELKSVIN